MRQLIVAVFLLGISGCASQYGCRTLKCSACDYGYARDENGCQTCTCIPNPCNYMDCEPDSTCEAENVYSCSDPPCDDIAVCKKQCPVFMCMAACEYGHVYDADECMTCECKPHPCAAVTCGPGHTCEISQPHCFTTPCDPIGECVPNTYEEEGSCKFGDPLPSIPNCGLGGQPCPETHFCNAHPADRYAICCAKRPDVCADYECPRRTRCVSRPMPCLIPPCPETAVCVPIYE